MSTHMLIQYMIIIIAYSYVLNKREGPLIHSTNQLASISTGPFKKTTGTQSYCFHFSMHDNTR